MNTSPGMTPESSVSTPPKPNAEFTNNYADEWIRFLKRRNALLTVVWSLLLVLSIGLLVAGLYFYQQQQLEREKNLRLETQWQEAQAGLVEWQRKHDALQQQVQTLQDERRNLEQMAGQNDSRLDLTSKMVDNLKEQIAALEAENATHIEALEKARELIRLQQDEATTAAQGLQEELSKREADLQERSSAYTALVNRNKDVQRELERMSAQLNEKHQVIDRLTRERDVSQQALRSMQANHEKLQREFKAMVTPVGPAASSGSATSSKAPVPTGALDPIVKPKTVAPQNKPGAASKPSSKEAGAFDYDEISID